MSVRTVRTNEKTARQSSQKPQKTGRKRNDLRSTTAAHLSSFCGGPRIILSLLHHFVLLSVWYQLCSLHKNTGSVPSIQARCQNVDLSKIECCQTIRQKGDNWTGTSFFFTFPCHVNRRESPIWFLQLIGRFEYGKRNCPCLCRYGFETVTFKAFYFWDTFLNVYLGSSKTMWFKNYVLGGSSLTTSVLDRPAGYIFFSSALSQKSSICHFWDFFLTYTRPPIYLHIRSFNSHLVLHSMCCSN